jgi:hypothetical protein
MQRNITYSSAHTRDENELEARLIPLLILSKLTSMCPDRFCVNA